MIRTMEQLNVPALFLTLTEKEQNRWIEKNVYVEDICILCNEKTRSLNCYEPYKGTPFKSDRYLYHLCENCRDRATLEDYNKIEELIILNEMEEGICL